MKKPPGDIISLHKCTKTHDHTLYYSWDMVCDGYNFYFSFCAIFCPFTPVTAQKQNISKKWKKIVWIYYHFAHEYHKSKSRCMISEIRSATDNFFSYFGPFFCSFTLPSQLHLNNPRNQLKKTALRKTP